MLNYNTNILSKNYILQIIESAKRTLEIEANALFKLIEYIDSNFENIIERLYGSTGRIVITGIGKSAIVAQKIVATLNSTGTPAVFMHAADAIHGDLGMVQQSDSIICISKSGNTPEIKLLVPLLKQSGNLLIGMVGDINSYLAKNADYILNTTVTEEACPNNLAPTTSTTAQIAMGDALAICLLEKRKFSKADFAKFHPGGALGKKLYLKVDDLYRFNQMPMVDINANLKDIIVEISSKRLGATAVIDNNKLVGVITDGDIRRMMEKTTDFIAIKAMDIMSKQPKTVAPNEMAIQALEIMKSNNITQLLVAENKQYLGFIHLHDLIREGII